MRSPQPRQARWFKPLCPILCHLSHHWPGALRCGHCTMQHSLPVGGLTGSLTGSQCRSRKSATACFMPTCDGKPCCRRRLREPNLPYPTCCCLSLTRPLARRGLTWLKSPAPWLRLSTGCVAWQTASLIVPASAGGAWGAAGPWSGLGSNCGRVPAQPELDWRNASWKRALCSPTT